MEARSGNGQDNISTFEEFESMIPILDATFLRSGIVVMPQGDNLGRRRS
jgi:hypothetical protein